MLALRELRLDPNENQRFKKNLQTARGENIKDSKKICIERRSGYGFSNLSIRPRAKMGKMYSRQLLP